MEGNQSMNVILDCLLFLMYRLYREQPDLHIKHSENWGIVWCGVYSITYLYILCLLLCANLAFISSSCSLLYCWKLLSIQSFFSSNSSCFSSGSAWIVWQTSVKLLLIRCIQSTCTCVLYTRMYLLQHFQKAKIHVPCTCIHEYIVQCTCMVVLCIYMYKYMYVRQRPCIHVKTAACTFHWLDVSFNCFLVT